MADWNNCAPFGVFGTQIGSGRLFVLRCVTLWGAEAGKRQNSRAPMSAMSSASTPGCLGDKREAARDSAMLRRSCGSPGGRRPAEGGRRRRALTPGQSFKAPQRHCYTPLTIVLPPLR